MAAISNAELLSNVNSCQARWLHHISADVAGGQQDHARAYLADCRQTYQDHQARQHDGVGGFLQLSGMETAPWEAPGAVAVGNAQVDRHNVLFSAQHACNEAQVYAAHAALGARKISHAAQGADCRTAGNAFFQTKRRLQGARRNLAACKARLKALEAGQSPAQAEAAAASAGMGDFTQQTQRIENRPKWASQLPAQSMAEGFRYAFPVTSDAFLERKAKIHGGHGGVFSGEIKRGVPSGVQSMLAARFAQLAQVQKAQSAAFSQPWTNPWSYEQFFANTPKGLPIWGGGYTSAFKPAGVMPGGTPGPQMPVAGAGVNGGWPNPGAATERF